MKVFGQIENAQLENKSSDYSSGVVGRIWWNDTSGQTKVDDGSNIRAILRNDLKAIIGNSGTANNNIRLHRGANGVLQFLFGGDATAEGSISASLNQISGRLENYTNAGKPAAGNAGRLAYISDLGHLLFDTGSDWIGTKVESYTNAGKPAAGVAGRVIFVTDLIELQFDNGVTWVTLSAASSGTSARMTALYDAVIGSAAQVITGAASHSTWASAIAAVSAGDTIKVLEGSWTETVSINKQLNIEGQGYGSYLTGTITFTNTSDKSFLRNIRTSDDITLNSGADSIKVETVWLASGKTFVDNGTANLLEGMQE
jgi:hypothetical protein